jgi:hypothetical protein
MSFVIQKIWIYGKVNKLLERRFGAQGGGLTFSSLAFHVFGRLCRPYGKLLVNNDKG